MPEGDTIHHAAKRVGAALVGQGDRVDRDAAPPPRAGTAGPSGWPGRGVRPVDARGKHLFVRFEGDLTLHSHLRMTGRWGVYRAASAGRRSPRRAWLVIRTAEHEVVQFDGPVLELMTDSRTRFDLRLAGLGRRPGGRLRRARFLRAPARGRPDPRDRRRAAGPAQPRRHRQHLEGRGLLHAGVDPWRADGRGDRRRGARDRARRAGR